MPVLRWGMSIMLIAEAGFMPHTGTAPPAVIRIDTS
jgi:hypothetical protein